MKIQQSVKFLALALVAAFFSFQGVKAQSVEQISPIKAKLMARNGAMMIDVREPDEVKALAYDVDGIVNIPLSEFQNRLNEIPKDKKIILACRSGNRSMRAATILAKSGYTQVYNMEGGIKGWQAKNLEVIVNGEKSKKACCAGDAKGKSSCGKKAKSGCCSGGAKKKSCDEKK